MPDVFVSSMPEGAPENKKKVAPPNPLSALMLAPKGVFFQNQESDEEIILLLRRHWITNLPWILVGGLMFLAPLLVSLLISIFGFSLPIPVSTLVVGQAFWYLISFGYLFINFLIWYFNAQLVTNERIVDIDFHDIVYKEVSATQLDKVQDVTFRMGGVIPHIFDYGDVLIQTAGTEPNFDFLAVPQPDLVARKIGDLVENAGGGRI